MYYDELKIWLKLGIPSALRSVAELLPWVITLTFVGRLSTDLLSALSLLETYMYGLMVIVWTGIHITSNTLISQAHGNRSIVGIRAWGVMTLLCMLVLTIITTGLWIASSPILKALQFDPVLVDTGYVYTLYAIPNLYLEAFAIPASAYITAIQRPDIPFYIQLIGAILDIIVTYVLLFVYDYGLKGAAIGWTAGVGLTVILYLGIFPWIFRDQREIKYGHDDDNNDKNDGSKNDDKNRITEYSLLLDKNDQKVGLLSNNQHESEESLNGTKVTNTVSNEEVEEAEAEDTSSTSLWKQTFRRCRTLYYWKTFWGQALPNLITTALSQWQVQMLSFLAAKFGSITIAAHNTSICLFEVLLTFAQGLSEATAVRIGHHLGNHDIAAAKRTMKLSLVCITGIGMTISIIGYSLRSNMGRIFSDDPQVLETIEGIALYFWIGYFVLSIGMWATAVLEGQGRATAQTVSFLIGGWGVMVPLGFAAWNLEPEWQLQGLWGALLIGYSVVTILACVFVYLSPWEKLLDEASERNENEPVTKP